MTTHLKKLPSVDRRIRKDQLTAHNLFGFASIFPRKATRISEVNAPGRHAKLTMNILRLDAGASAIEFALIIPFLLMLAGGIVEMANVFFVRSQLNEIVRDATRRLAVESLTPDETRKFITKRLAETTNAKGDIDVSQSTEKEEEEVDVTVSLGVPLKDILIFDFVADSLGGSKEKPTELSVSVTMFKH